jgi:hypothetical protein
MLYLAYDNKALADGAGGQIQRILSIYLVAKIYGIGYIHQPILSMTYQGAKCLETNQEDKEQIVKYNQLIALRTQNVLTQNVDVYKVYDISHEIITEFMKSEKDVILLVLHAGTYIDEHPELMLNQIDLPWNFPWKLHGDPSLEIVRIAVHVRRGELFAVDSTRMLPNSYYVECMQALETIFQESGIIYEFHLYTEQVTKPVEITPQHHGICNRISTSVMIRPEDNHLEDFAGFSQIVYHINECPVDTLKQLTTADVLLASRSSFSYIAGMMKKEGVVLFHPFWHRLSPAWIPTKSAKDIYAARDTIVKRVRAAVLPL